MKTPLNSVFELKPAPRVLVEASAGTGKTYTIVGIFVRLLIEKDLEVDQILAVTFTKKATAELRSRILEKLRSCLNALEEKDAGEDSFTEEFLAWISDREYAIAKLRHAIHNFDDSQVFTIHGFCQKILQEQALLAGTSFELELTPSDELLHQAAQDYWRTFMYKYSGFEAGHYLITKMLGVASTPEELIGNEGVGPLIEKPYANPEGETLDDPLDYLRQVVELKTDMQNLWQDQEIDIRDILENCNVKRYGSYLDSRLQKLVHFLNDNAFSHDAPQSLGYFTGDYLYDENNLKKNCSPTRPHDFFDLCSDFNNLVSDINKVETTLIMNAYEGIRKRREKLAIQSETITYNDLLVHLRDALLTKDEGKKLAAKLLERYPVALVDEFQDTDPVQYDIFDAIYPPENTRSSLMMIGDPKQAIYAFRGADLYTYFRAKENGISSQYTLGKNYRSTKSYIEAINTLFEGDHKPFIEDEIDFLRSDAGSPDASENLVVDGEISKALKLVTQPCIESNKNNAKDFPFDETVYQIAGLLEKAENGSAFIGDKKLKAGDIAILISSHAEANELKKRLKVVGIDAVTQTREIVFQTYEARRVEMLMAGILEPGNPQKFNTALLSGFFGIDLNRLYQLKDDESRRQDLLDEFTALHDIWQQKGFYAMFYSVLNEKKGMSTLAELDQAERILTNLHQLAEICSSVEKEENLDPARLYTWVLRQMTDPDKDDDRELQLESDQNLVKILTIHASKGLQFPVVFCPTLWCGRTPGKDKVAEYHRKTAGKELMINIDRNDNEQRREAVLQHSIESIAEEVRKMYVALTRAQYASNIIWNTHRDSLYSGLGASLIGREKLIESISNKSKVKEDAEISDQWFINKFKKLAEKNPESIGAEVLDESRKRTQKISWNQDSKRKMKLTSYTGRTELPVQKKLASFSSLAGYQTDPVEPDYDQVMNSYADAFTTDRDLEEATDIFHFPRGATAGTAIHKLFEHEDFKFNTAKKADHTKLIIELMEEYRFDERWRPVLQQMLRDVVQAEIPGLNLNALKTEDQLREMEFHFPISDPRGEELLRIIRGGNPDLQQPVHSLNYMVGFIDLVVRQNGVYYIVDYKSNHLGDHLEDYEPDKLKQEIHSANYDLQYHLYTVALIKYLKKRIPGFNYNDQFGGVAYLFVRGMRPGSRNGVWFDKPDWNVIKKLEKMLYR